ncbi:TonB-dependent receptor [Pararcticibacter amylolyticus]|uniref:TonB-dependent receptor n=1 Tax=Pararcticibacter amylolyticus TaxID=2173175 RepID=UPI001304E65E|nr:TonB-dependent receptor [Pararcticibacter amylolyticus]
MLYPLCLVWFLLSSYSIAHAQNDNGILNRKISVELNDVTIGNALTLIGQKAGCTFVYSNSLLKSERRISASYSSESLARILKELLGDAANGIMAEGSQITIRTPGTGTVAGTVSTSDGKPAGYVTVSIRGIKSVQVNPAGEFVIKNVPSGTHNLTASFIGLETQRKEVVVRTDATTSVSFVLRESRQQLQEVIITSKTGKGYVEDQPSSSLRLATPVMLTPQNITVITSSIIQDQQLLTTSDIAKNISGVTNTIPYASASTGFSIRGTQSSNNRLRNGMPVSTLMGYGIAQEDMSYVESVEFIKGPAGFMLAQGEPGGMYNVVTKKPLNNYHASAGFTLGSYNLYRSTVDIGGPLSKKLYYRLNVMGQNAGTHIDYGKNNRLSIAPVIRYDLDDRTSLTAEFNLDMVGLLGTNNIVPTRNQQPLKRSFSVADPALGVTKLRNNYGYLNLRHRLNDNWQVTAQTGMIVSKWKGQDLYALNSLVDAAGMLPRRLRYIDFNDNLITGQVFLNGKGLTGAIEHTILAGIDGGSLNTKGKHADVNNILPINVDQPAYGLSRGIDTLINESSLHYGYANLPATAGVPSRTSWQAVMLQDDIKLLPWLQLTIGGRYTYYSNGSDASPKKDKVFTPRAGLVISPLENTSVYALYDQSFLQQGGRAFSGEEFKPLTGDNIEFGVKREWLGRALFTQISVFRITKNNLLTNDPDNIGYSVQTGQVRSTGFETDILGRLSANFSVVANYSYINAKVTKDNNADLIGTRQVNPVHTFNVWLRYKVESGLLQGVGAALGTSYYADRYITTVKKQTSDPQRKLPDFKSTDAAIYYSKGSFSTALNVDNIGNTYNYSANNFNGNRGAEGEFYIKSLPGRNYRLSVAVKF